MTVGKNGPAAVFRDVDIMKTLTSGFNYEKDDLWNGCVFISKKYEDYALGGYSVIASQDSNSDFYGRVCVKPNIYIYTKKDFVDGTKPFYSTAESGPWGNAFVFMNRLGETADLISIIFINLTLS